MGDAHIRQNQESFAQQAETFEDARFNRVLMAESDWVFDGLARGAEDLVLDVAAGTGHAARTLAPDVRAVVALDATKEMLEVGREQARQAGLDNIIFLHGRAAASPFLDASFDVVVCRYALHHFPEPDAELAEMARCVKPGGTVVLVDLVADADAGVAERQNALELLRDPSHARALSSAELVAALARHGLEVVSVEQREVRRPLQPWMEQTKTPREAAAEIKRALAAELDGGPTTGFQPQRGTADELTMVQTLASLVARSPRR
jgi:ubiquinone/menaquinone biosynthesis C-methylase UbiE